MDQLDLTAFFQTKMGANDFSSRIAAISEKIYHTDFNLEKMLSEQFGIKKKDRLITLLRENKVDVKSNSALKAFLSSIVELIPKLPVLSLTIAFEPKEKTLQALSEWSLLNINKQALFDITVDKNLIAGAVVNYKGKYLDFSIRPRFEQILLESLEEETKETEGTKETQGAEPKNEAKHQSMEHLSLGR